MARLSLSLCVVALLALQLAADEASGTCDNAAAAAAAPVDVEAEKAMTFVTERIAAHKVIVFSKSYCPYCRGAKQTLGQYLTPDQVEVVELDELPARHDPGRIQTALGKLTGARSVPRVFIDGKFVGGGDDTAAKAANGELEALLTAAGVLSAAGTSVE